MSTPSSPPSFAAAFGCVLVSQSIHACRSLSFKSCPVSFRSTRPISARVRSSSLPSGSSRIAWTNASSGRVILSRRQLFERVEAETYRCQRRRRQPLQKTFAILGDRAYVASDGQDDLIESGPVPELPQGRSVTAHPAVRRRVPPGPRSRRSPCPSAARLRNIVGGLAPVEAWSLRPEDMIGSAEFLVRQQGIVQFRVLLHQFAMQLLHPQRPVAVAIQLCGPRSSRRAPAGRCAVAVSFRFLARLSAATTRSDNGCRRSGQKVRELARQTFRNALGSSSSSMASVRDSFRDPESVAEVGKTAVERPGDRRGIRDSIQ